MTQVPTKFPIPAFIKLYAFDVDHTLVFSGGPVTLDHLVELKTQGHILGLCGNWGLVTSNVMGWQHLFSFIGPIGSTKADMLKQLWTYVRGVNEHVMVGNDPSIFGGSADKEAADEAGWRFIREHDFARGMR